MNRLPSTLVVALVAWVSSCASHIEPVLVPPRVAPSLVPPPIRACWAEFAQSAGFTASGILVQHPQGAVLIDAGQSANFAEEISAVPLSERLYLRAVPGALIPSIPSRDVVRGMGVDPAALRFFIPTHAHSDHVGGLMDLPDVTVLAPRAELDALEHAQTRPLFNILPAHAQRVKGHTQELKFVDAPYEIFASHADVFGDGAVVVVSLAGHTPGSVGVFLNVDGRRIFYVGDAVNTVGAIADRRGKAFYLARTDNDAARANVVVAQLHALHQQLPALTILPAHERTAWMGTFKQPGGCVGVQASAGPATSPPSARSLRLSDASARKGVRSLR